MALSWFAPLLKKESPLLYSFDAFFKEFAATFGEADRERVADTKIRSCDKDHTLCQLMQQNFDNLHMT